ncbi:hypothetical protein L1987_48699 [Smallanthus sonchifolius]|uniref:Uncharacterized protein n=1 Tax=Smallanthus sonchifolius TaxID=185202 RepID=A0ACB9FTK9_9ASTR|nr:hypothetical protein L1987_48699 [Smallanthus sonchifolius]
MALQLSINLSSTVNIVSSSNPQHPWRLVSDSPRKSSRVCKFKSIHVSPRATIALSTTQGNLRQPMVISCEVDVSNRFDKLKENTRRTLMTASNPTMTMKLVDMIQRLGLGYSFEEEIKMILETLGHGQSNDDLYTAALRFRILRENNLHPNPVRYSASTSGLEETL